jgi:hypothetical protein
MLNKTKVKMGNKYFTYKASDNNCQYFSYNFLLSNNLASEETKFFILQDVRSLFDQDIRFRKIVNTVTDVGKVVPENNVIQRGLRVMSPIYNALGSTANLFRKIKF